MGNRHWDYPIRLTLLGPSIAAMYFGHILLAGVPKIYSLLTLGFFFQFYQDIIGIKHCANLRYTV